MHVLLEYKSPAMDAYFSKKNGRSSTRDSNTMQSPANAKTAAQTPAAKTETSRPDLVKPSVSPNNFNYFSRGIFESVRQTAAFAAFKDYVLQNSDLILDHTHTGTSSLTQLKQCRQRSLSTVLSWVI